MARVLRTKLDLDNANALRKARQFKGALSDVGEQGKDASKKLTGGMNAGASATAGFTNKVMALGASYVGLSALTQALRGIIGAYNEVNELKDKFAQQSAGANRAIAGSAAQFGVSEPDMRRLLVDVGQQVGAGAQDLGALGSLSQAMASTGLIAPVGPGGTMTAADRASFIAMGRFQQRTQTMGSSSDLAKMVGAIQGADPSVTTPGALGMLETAFGASQLSNWGDFFAGATRGTLGLLAKGIAPQQILGAYASQAQFEATGTGAGETLNTIYSQMLLADKPQMVAHVDKLYGKGTYWKLKAEDPTQLYSIVTSILTGSEGEAQAQLFRKLGVEATTVGRIEELKSGRANSQAFAGAIGIAGPSTPRDVAWRGGPRATKQVGELLGDDVTATAGDEAATSAALRDIADAERELLKQQHPWYWGAVEWGGKMNPTSVRNQAMQHYVMRRLGEEGVDVGEYMESGQFPTFAIGDEGATMNIGTVSATDPRYQALGEKVGGLLSAPVTMRSFRGEGPTVNIGVNYNNMPGDRAQNDITRTGD